MSTYIIDSLSHQPHQPHQSNLPQPRLTSPYPTTTNTYTMAQKVDWSPSHCLACDRQSDTNAFCSQLCRLAECETTSVTSVHSTPQQQPEGSQYTSSSSQSSLISIQRATSGVPGEELVSEEARKELRGYANAFDLSRWRQHAS